MQNWYTFTVFHDLNLNAIHQICSKFDQNSLDMNYNSRIVS